MANSSCFPVSCARPSPNFPTHFVQEECWSSPSFELKYPRTYCYLIAADPGSLGDVHQGKMGLEHILDDVFAPPRSPFAYTY